MRYTRYDMKRKNNSNLIMIIVLLSTLLFAFLIGTVVSNVFIKNSKAQMDTEKPNNAVDVVNKSEAKKIVKLVAVQGGMFKEAGNLDKAKNNLSAFGNPFTIEEQNGTRVLLGIYNEEEALNIIKILTEKNIDNSKMVFEINISNGPCEEEIAGAINAELDVLSKLSDKNVKSVQSAPLKEWAAASLKEVDKSSKNIALLNEIKTHINELPNEIESSKVPEYYAFLFNFMRKSNLK